MWIYSLLERKNSLFTSFVTIFIQTEISHNYYMLHKLDCALQMPPKRSTAMSEYAKRMFIDDEAKESGKRQFSDGDFEDEMVSEQFSSISRTGVSYFDVITVFMYMHINAQIHHRVNNFEYLHKGRKL